MVHDGLPGLAAVSRLTQAALHALSASDHYIILCYIVLYFIVLYYVVLSFFFF